MAEFLEIPYREVMLAALLPSVLYFLAVFIQVDLLAAQRGIAAMPREAIPPLRRALREGGHFLLPFVVLLYGLFGLDMRPERAALFASASLVVLALAFGYRGRRPSAGELWQGVVGAGRAVTEVVTICGAAGIVIGTLSLTGLAFNLTLHLIAASGGILAVLVLLTAVVSIVLGMGMPTVGVYVLLATLVAPALTKAGVEPIAAHMFVMYFGMLSMVTPPVALAAFAAANVANADPWRTSWSAVKLAWSAYIVPFLFVFAPSLLLIGTTHRVAWAVATALIGVYAISVAIVGFLRDRVSPATRVLFAAAGLAVLTPAGAWDGAIYGEIAGLTVLAVLLVAHFRRSPAAAA